MQCRTVIAACLWCWAHLIHSIELVVLIGGGQRAQQAAKSGEQEAICGGQGVVGNAIGGWIKVVQIAQQEPGVCTQIVKDLLIRSEGAKPLGSGCALQHYMMWMLALISLHDQQMCALCMKKWIPKLQHLSVKRSLR